MPSVDSDVNGRLPIGQIQALFVMQIAIGQEHYRCELFTYVFHKYQLVPGARDATTFHSKQEPVEPGSEAACSRLAIPP